MNDGSDDGELAYDAVMPPPFIASLKIPSIFPMTSCSPSSITHGDRSGASGISSPTAIARWIAALRGMLPARIPLLLPSAPKDIGTIMRLCSCRWMAKKNGRSVRSQLRMARAPRDGDPFTRAPVQEAPAEPPHRASVALAACCWLANVGGNAGGRVRSLGFQAAPIGINSAWGTTA